MPVFDVNGNSISSVFGKNADVLPYAYKTDGSVIRPEALKVMSYNVGGWYTGSGGNVPADKKSEYYELQTGMIRGNDPDVLLIQEYLPDFSADGTSALAMLETLFPYVHAVPSGTYYGRAVCSRFPISNYTERTYTSETSRYYDTCQITVAGTQITLVNTHLDTFSQDKRTAQITELLSFLEKVDNFVLCGDFNTAITQSTANTSSTPYTNNVKPFIDAGYNTANFGSFGFMVTCIDGLADVGTKYYLDNVYASDNITVSSAHVDTTKLTDDIDEKVDHMPIIAELQIG